MARVTPNEAMSAAVVAMSGPFEWWLGDCCTSACVAFNSLWGINPMAGFPSYSDKRGAVEFMRKHGGREGCPEFVANNTGLIECKPVAGAISAAWVTPRRWALGICVDEENTAFKAGNGMTVRKDVVGRFWVPSCHQ